jgi:hypothetical protein
VIRRLLEQGSSTEIAAQGLETITTAIRKTIKAELKTTENRMAKLSAKAVKFDQDGRQGWAGEDTGEGKPGDTRL